jgi:hypothetical protein
MASSSYAPGLTKNQKRGLRRSNLEARLALARRDARGMEEEPPLGRSVSPPPECLLTPEPKVEPEVRGRPSRAAHLDEVKDEPKSEGSDVDASRLMGEDVRSSSEEAKAKPKPSSSSWLQAGLAKKEELRERGRGPLRLRSVEPARRESSAGPSSGLETPPWRREARDGSVAALQGIKRVLPRWEVELAMAEEQRVPLTPDEVVLSKICAQLLRWGRADIVANGGQKRSLRLDSWEPGKWYTAKQLARTMGVASESLTTDILRSEGSHGPRALSKNEGGEMFFKARWTEECEQQAEQQRGRRGGRGQWRRNR